MNDKAGELQIRHDERHQRHEWRIELFGWAITASVLAAALGGILGAGPASRAEAENGALRVEYRRFIHYQGPERLTVHIGPAVAAGGRVRLWLDQRFVESMELQRVDPMPAAVEVQGNRHIWVFLVPREGEPLVATFRLMPDFIGHRQVDLGIDQGPELSLWQFAFP